MKFVNWFDHCNFFPVSNRCECHCRQAIEPPEYFRFKLKFDSTFLAVTSLPNFGSLRPSLVGSTTNPYHLFYPTSVWKKINQPPCLRMLLYVQLILLFDQNKCSFSVRFRNLICDKKNLTVPYIKCSSGPFVFGETIILSGFALNFSTE